MKRATGDPSGITRRQFVGGTAVAVGGALAGRANPALGEAPATKPAPVRSGAPLGYRATQESFPPLRAGLRGSDMQANAVAHQMALEGRTEWGSATQPDPDTYDLVVVGAGISGLAAAHFYRKRNPDARVLILENHDDIGGHARRNEFHLDGRMYLGGGGSRYLMPTWMADHLDEFYKDVGIDMDAMEEAQDFGFYERHGLKTVWYFDEKTYGTKRIVPAKVGILPNLGIPELPSRETIERTPFSEQAKRELHALYHFNEDRTEAGLFSEYGYLNRLSYEEFLKRHGGITQQEILDWFRSMSVLQGIPNHVNSAITGFGMGQPGLGATSFRLLRGNRLGKLAMMALKSTPFPDGNGGLARLMARRLVPGVSSAPVDPAALVTAPFDYAKLDLADTPVRIRLSSTVVNVRHEGDPKTAKTVSVTYRREGRTQSVRCRNVVLACWNNVIPYIWKEIPESQSEALRKGIKVPLTFTNVLLRNWRPFKEAGISGGFASSFYHSIFYLEHVTKLGSYGSDEDPDEPTVLFLCGAPTGSLEETDLWSWAKTARYEMLSRPFSYYEDDLKEQLNGMLGDRGFDFDRDVAGITVNRWPHGYAHAQPPADPPTRRVRSRTSSVARSWVGWRSRTPTPAPCR